METLAALGALWGAVEGSGGMGSPWCILDTRQGTGGDSELPGDPGRRRSGSLVGSGLKEKGAGEPLSGLRADGEGASVRGAVT